MYTGEVSCMLIKIDIITPKVQGRSIEWNVEVHTNLKLPNHSWKETHPVGQHCCLGVYLANNMITTESQP